jgi:hypothetical protein
MKVQKWLWILLALLVVASGVLAYAAVNLNSYLAANRELIAQRAALAVGRPVRFDRLELSVGRGLGIAVHDLAIGEDPDFGTGDFLTARSGFVQIRILPALFGRYEVARVALESPTISLVRTARGTNLEAMNAGKEDTGDASTAKRSAVAIALLDINDGTVRYVDRTSKPAREIIATQVTFDASDLSFGDALRFELSAAMLGADAPNLSASGAVGPFDPRDVAATPLDVILQLDNVDGKSLLAALPGRSDLRVEGPTTATLELGGTIAASTLNFTVNPSRARVVYGSVFDKPSDTELTVAGHLARGSDDTWLADAIDIETSSSTLTIRGNLGRVATATQYSASLNGTGLAIGDWASMLPALRDAGVQGRADVALEIAKPKNASLPTIDGRIGMDGVEARFADGPAAVSHLSGVLSFEGRSVALVPTDLRIGGASARLEARVEDVFAPVVSFKLSAPSLPLSALSREEVEDSIDGLEASGRLSLTGQTPELDAQARANTAVIRRLPISNVRATIAGRGGNIRIDPLTFHTCGGSVRGELARTTGNKPAQPPRVAMELSVGGLNLDELAAAFIGARGDAPASGILSFDLSAAGIGNDWPSLLEALGGSGRFDIANGAIHGVNVPEAALERLTGLPGLSALLPSRLRTDFPFLFGQEETRFDSLNANFQIASGRLKTNNLVVKSRDYSIDAAGTLGFDLGVDLSATLTASQELSNRLIDEVATTRLLANHEGRVAVPFRLVGGLPAVKVEPEWSVLTGLLRRGLVETLSDKLLGGGKQKPPASLP